MNIIEVLTSALFIGTVVALVGYVAYCNDVALQEWRDTQDAAGDCLTPADLTRMGIVNPDFTVGWIDRGANPYWRQPDAHYNGVPVYWDGWQAPNGDEPIRSIHFGYNSAVPGRDQCGQPSGQEAISPHPVNGFGSDAGACEGVTTPGRESGEAAGHD